MNTLSAADKAKQDAARETDGKFGNQLHGEPEGGPDVLAAPAAPSPLDALRSMEGSAFLAEARHEHLYARRSHLAGQAVAGMIRDRFPEAANIIFEDHHVHGLSVDHVTDANGEPLGLGPGDQFELYDSGENPYFSDLVDTIDYGNTFGLKDYAANRPRSARYMFSVEIDPFLADPAPADARWDTDPRSKALTADEQNDLVEAAYYALPSIEESAEESEDHHARQRHEELKEALEKLLAGARHESFGR